MQRRVAIFVDGENIGSAHAAAIHGIGAEQGEIRIARVYGNVQKLNGWQEAAPFSVVHSGTGKNATDIHLSLDALELALDGRFDTCVVASSDRDFSHLAAKLRERGLRFVGTGEAKSPRHFAGKCSEFRILGPTVVPATKAVVPPPPTDDLDGEIRKAVEAKGANGSILIPVLNAELQERRDFRIAQRPERTWKGFIRARSDRYEHLPGSPPRLRLRSPTRAA
jgi:hypothetical protein